MVCIVHGEAQPEVVWLRDTMQIDQTERHIVEHHGARNTLIIRKVHAQDFGNYTCLAENPLGRSKQIITLSGKPNTATIRSPTIGQWKDRYNISWAVHSYAPIEEYKLLFKPYFLDPLEFEKRINLQEKLEPYKRSGYNVRLFYSKSK